MSFITVGITFDQLVTLKSNQVGAVHGHNWPPGSSSGGTICHASLELVETHHCGHQRYQSHTDRRYDDGDIFSGQPVVVVVVVVSAGVHSGGSRERVLDAGGSAEIREEGGRYGRGAPGVTTRGHRGVRRTGTALIARQSKKWIQRITDFKLYIMFDNVVFCMTLSSNRISFYSNS